VAAVTKKLTGAGVRLAAYDVPAIRSGESDIRKVFEFAKGMKVLTIVAGLCTRVEPGWHA
jgi:hypothetical protein